MPSQHKYGMGKTGKSFELELPSGETCLMRKLGIQELIGSGLLDSFDSLTSLIKDLHLDRVATGRVKQQDQQEMMATLVQNPEKWKKFQEMLDGVVVAAVIEPKVYPAPEPGESRMEDVLYVDQVDFADRSEVMKAAMAGVIQGVGELEPFREGSTEDLSVLDDVAGLSRETKRAAKRAKRGSGSVPGPGGDHIRKGHGSGHRGRIQQAQD